MNDKILSAIIFLMLMMTKSTSTTIKDPAIPEKSVVLTKALVYIFEHCHRKYNTVMIIDNSRSIVKSFLTTSTLTSIFLDDNFKIVRKPDQLRKRTDALIMSKKSFIDFSENVTKNGLWWNVETPCFIINTNKNDNDFGGIFLRHYEHIPLMLFYLTFNKHNAIIISGINQYRSKHFKIDIPPFWFKTRGPQFSRLFDAHTVCNEFYYNRLSYKQQDNNVVITSQEVSILELDYARLYNQHFDALRIEFHTIHVAWLQTGLRKVERFKPPENDWKIVYKDVYLLIWDSSPFDNLYYELTFPIRFYQFNFLVHHHGYKTPFEKIRDYYGVWTVLSLLFILCMIFIVLKLSNKRRNVSFISFEILRVLINTAFLTPLNFSSSRIFMSAIFLYFLILHSTFSGHLVEFLTKLEPRKNPETLEDLKDSQYKFIFYPHVLSEYIKDVGLADKAQPYDVISECMSQIVLSQSVVCIADDSELIRESSFSYKIRDTLYKPQKGFRLHYTPTLARRDKQTRLKVDRALFHLFESGIDNYVQGRKNMRLINPHKWRSAQNNQDFIPLNAKILEPIFIMLGIGLVCAIISFVIEILKHKQYSDHL